MGEGERVRPRPPCVWEGVFRGAMVLMRHTIFGYALVRLRAARAGRGRGGRQGRARIACCGGGPGRPSELRVLWHYCRWRPRPASGDRDGRAERTGAARGCDARRATAAHAAAGASGVSPSRSPCFYFIPFPVAMLLLYPPPGRHALLYPPPGRHDLLYSVARAACVCVCERAVPPPAPVPLTRCARVVLRWSCGPWRAR